MYDCIIVGAGPAGSTVAYHLSQQGRRVLLLEKASLPRYKPCSGAVSPSIAQWFDFDLTPAIDRTLRHVHYTWKLEDAVDAELKTQVPIWIVKRDVFDHFLVQQAQAKGAELKDGTAATGIKFGDGAWTVQTSAGAVQGKYLVAADGAEGPMAKWLGFKDQKLRTAAVLEVETASPLAATSPLSFEFGMVKNGCLWSFPKQQGYAIGATTFIGGDVKDFTTALKQYAPAFGVAYEAAQAHYHGLKLWDGNRPLHTQQAVVVGEAGAIVDPLTAEGIRHGIFSGVQAAAAIHRALNGEANALAGYTETMHSQWGADMQWAQRIAGVFYRVPGIGYKVGIKRPTATERLGQLLAGDIRYGDVAGRVIKRLSGSLLPGMK